MLKKNDLDLTNANLYIHIRLVLKLFLSTELEDA